MMDTPVINLEMPDVPIDIFSLAEIDPDLTYTMRCEELWNEVYEEVTASEYRRRSHHNTGTYDLGCRGPLCRKAHREHPRRRAKPNTPLEFNETRIYDPVLEYFHIVVKFRIKKFQLLIMEDL